MKPSPSWDTHSVLLSKLKHFDEQSAWGLVEGHFRAPIEALARRSGLEQAEVQDVVQDTLLTFARLHRAGGYDPAKGRLRSWLFGIAQKQIAVALRRQQRSRREQAPGLSQLAIDALEGHWHEEWERHLLRRCLRRAQLEVLPRTFEIFSALTFTEESPAALAARLGVPITVIYNAKSRVSKRLQELVLELEDEA